MNFLCPNSYSKIYFSVKSLNFLQKKSDIFCLETRFFSIYTTITHLSRFQEGKRGFDSHLDIQPSRDPDWMAYGCIHTYEVRINSK